MKGEWDDRWGEEPPIPDHDDDPTGAPGYFVPPGPKKDWPRYSHGYLGSSAIMNSCPRCGGDVAFRRRDNARWCSSCQRVFYAMSEDSIIRHVPPAEG